MKYPEQEYFAHLAPFSDKLPRARRAGRGARLRSGPAFVGKQGTNSGKSTIGGGRGVVFIETRPPFPKIANLLLLGNGVAQPIGGVHDSYSFVLVFGLVGARNQHFGESVLYET